MYNHYNMKNNLNLPAKAVFKYQYSEYTISKQLLLQRVIDIK